MIFVIMILIITIILLNTIITIIIIIVIILILMGMMLKVILQEVSPLTCPPLGKHVPDQGGHRDSLLPLWQGPASTLHL